MAADNPKRRGTDWTAARDFWLALDPQQRSFEEVGAQFGVSGQRVGFVAKRDGWRKIADDLDRKALEQTKRRVLRSRQERNEVFLKIADAAFDRALEKLTAGELEVRLADLPALGKHAELILGEATDRVSFAELQEALGVAMTLGVQAIRDGWSVEDYLGTVRDRLGAIEAQQVAA